MSATVYSLIGSVVIPSLAAIFGAGVAYGFFKAKIRELCNDVHCLKTEITDLREKGDEQRNDISNKLTAVLERLSRIEGRLED